MDRREARGIAYLCTLEGKVTQEAHSEAFWNCVIEALSEPKIIRCKDCKYSYCQSLLSEMYCTYHECCTDDNNFCSWAERRSDGEK